MRTLNEIPMRLMMLLLAALPLSAAPATSPTTAPATREQARLKLHALLQQGTDALAARQPEAALACYLDARALYDLHLRPRGLATTPDDDQVAVFHGLAIAYQLLDKPEKVSPLFEAHSVLDRACAARNVSRQLLLTRGALDCAQGFLAMRTAVRISQYLKEHPDELDSELLDVFFTALIKSEDRVSNRALTFDPAIKQYEQLNARLEETRPGQKRYGVKWMSPAEYSAAMSTRRSALRDYESAVTRADDAVARVKEADRYLDRMRSSKDRGAINAASNSLAAARNRAAAANKEVAEAKARIPPIPVLTSDQLEQLMLPHPVTLVATPGIKSPAATQRTIEGGQIVANPPKTDSPTTQVARVSPPREFLGERRTRTFTRSAAGFAVAPDLVLVPAAAVKDATHIILESADRAPLEGTVERRDDTLALIRIPKQRMAYFSLGQSFVGGAITCPAFPQVSIFGVQAEIIGGSATASKEGFTVSLQKHPRLAGSPLLSQSGEVLGIELAARDDSRERCPAISVEAVRAFLARDLPADNSPNPAHGAIFQVTASYEK